MAKMVGWSLAGAFLGFLVLAFTFELAVGAAGFTHPLAVAFSIMGSIPAGAIGALFAAVRVLQEEMRETRREMKHWQSIIQMAAEEQDRPSTQFKSGTPKRD